MLRFANRYGRLGNRVGDGITTSVVRVDAAPGVSAQSHANVELFDAWHRTIVWVREAVRLWDLVEDADADSLEKVIRWEGPGLVNYYPPPEVARELKGGDHGWRDAPEKERRHYKGQDLLGRASQPAAILRASIKQGDVLRPAVLFVHQLIEEHLPRNVGPRLIWDCERKRSLLQECPFNLLGVIALQFAEEVYSRRRPRRCPVCARWFDLGTVAGRSRRQTRSDRETCSSGCRTRAYRQRQASARKMFAEGKSVREIAKSLGCKPGAVKGWVMDTKGKG
jgi:hypothetical protein